MRNGSKTLRNSHFQMTVTENGCIDRIRPRLSSVQAQVATIGAIADENARPAETVTRFFDPRVSGDCRIHDELTHSVYSFRHHTRPPKQWSAVQRWTDRKDYWEWHLELRHCRGPERELRVELCLPHPIFPGPPGSGHSNWQLWLPTAAESLGSEYGIRKIHFCKCIDEQTDVPLPLCTLFHAAPGASLGFSCLLPPDQTWYTDFEVVQREWLAKITFNHLGLTRNGQIDLRLWCFSHDGDWRCALGWVRRKFPALLGPVAGQEKLDGNMAYTIPMIPERRIRDWSRKMHLRWNELFYFRDFGEYLPREPFDASQFKTPDHPEWSVDGLTYDDINRYIDLCHKHNVKVMPYFNIGDCESGIARRHFPESIVRTVAGEEMVTWIYYDKKTYTLLMNSDPAYPWFDFVLSQFEQLLKRCPGIDGLFFDQMGYGWIDTAHFDGVTFYNNRPAYNMAHMYLRALKKVREAFPRPRINGLGNGVVRWQMMEYLDGVMAEGDPATLGRLALLCPERPTICLAEGEAAFQSALYYGAWLHVSPYYRYPTTEPLPKDAVRLFARYMPLLEILTGRKWVYAPTPLEVRIDSDNLYKTPLLTHRETPRANIFKTAAGDYAVVVLAVPKGTALAGSRWVPLTVRVRVPESDGQWRAVIFGVDRKGYDVERPVVTPDGRLDFRVPRHGAATLILLTRDVRRLRTPGNQIR